MPPVNIREFEAVARERMTPSGPLWFQLYVYRDRAVTAELIGRAEAAGYRAGIRRGVDVMKALALGAKAVLVGRPCLWGLAVTVESR